MTGEKVFELQRKIVGLEAQLKIAITGLRECVFYARENIKNTGRPYMFPALEALNLIDAMNACPCKITGGACLKCYPEE